MAAATAARDTRRKMSDRVAYLAAAGVKIYKGTFVVLRNDGYAYPARNGTATDKFIGVAYDTVDNSAGIAGAASVLVQKIGTYVFAKAAAAQTDMGTTVYASDDSTATSAAGGGANQSVGQVCDVIDGSTIRVRIDLACQ